MKIHTGVTKRPGTITFIHEGYWYKGPEDERYTFIRYPAPKPRPLDIKRMWGLGIGGWFIGVMRTKAK